MENTEVADWKIALQITLLPAAAAAATVPQARKGCCCYWSY